MATITATPTDAPRTGNGVRHRARTAMATARRQATTTVSAVRLHDWSPALTVGGLGSAVISAWTTFGRGAAWAALAAALLLFDLSRD